ncbi:MAG: glycosyltransferase family 2 protein [Anaerolineales bacterium]|jgi:GT2 family glycosyltransferase|nr:glycosyltransferase family 2 protein [Anaerolineales bacterium]
MSLADPCVSVVMPVRDGARTVAQALRSVLSGTLDDLELIVIDDGSRDATARIVEGFAQRDPRVRLFSQAAHGVAASRNRGFAAARGRFIAWLDADDLSLPGRLERQLACLEAQPELAILGGAAYLLRAGGGGVGVSAPPLSDSAIRCALPFDNPFIQSAVMLRRETLLRGALNYNPAYVHCEDYELWSRLLECGRGMNLRDPLIVRREHPAQRSRAEQDEVRAWAERIAQTNLQRLGLDLPVETVRRLRGWLGAPPRAGAALDETAAAALWAILDRLERDPRLDRGEIRLLRGRFTLRLALAGPSGLRRLTRFRPGDLAAMTAYLRQRRRREQDQRRLVEQAADLPREWQIEAD